MEKLNGYDLSRIFFDWSFENPDKIKPIHTAIYFFAVEHCNRLGWKEKFGFPSQMVMEAIGIKNWRTYSKGLNDLVEFGFIEMIEISKNQYSSNIIAIVKNTKAPTKALDKALQKHSTKQGQSTVSIDKQLNNKQLNNKQEETNTFDDIKNYFIHKCINLSKPQVITKKRKSVINARLKDYDLKTIKKVIDITANSDFLNGVNDKGWKADFDWILNPNNFIKILEGNYGDKELPKKEIPFNERMTEKEFLSHWNDYRVRHGRFPTSKDHMIPKGTDFIKIVKHYSKRDIQKAIIGLMTQKECNLNLKTSLRHILKLEMFIKYLDAFNNKNTMLYASQYEKKTQML